MSLPTPNTPGYTSFRGRTCCVCLAEWLLVFEAELIRRGVIEECIDIAQLTGGYEGSGGTHLEGGAADIWQHDEVTVWVARQMGADAAWARTTGSFVNNRHTHLVLSGCPHNGPARYQIDEVRAGGDGLVGSTPDPGPRPLSGRTWRQGIEWARQQEDIMASTAELGELLDRKLAPLIRRLDASREREIQIRKRAIAIERQLEDLERNGATRTQLRRLRDDVANLVVEDEPAEPS